MDLFREISSCINICIKIQVAVTFLATSVFPIHYSVVTLISTKSMGVYIMKIGGKMDL